MKNSIKQRKASPSTLFLQVIQVALQRNVNFHRIQFKMTSWAKINYIYKTPYITKIPNNPQIISKNFKLLYL